MIAIISGSPLELSPYLKLYINLFENNSIPYLLIINQQKNSSDIKNSIFFDYKYKRGFLNFIIRSVKGFLFILRAVHIYKIKGLVLTPTRTAFRIFPLLIFFKNRFIFDIRDLTHENKFFFRFIQKIIINMSYKTFISSRGFLNIIKKSNKIKVIHNLPTYHKDKHNMELFLSKYITIKSLGMISYPKENYYLYNQLDDSRFLLLYQGLLANDWTRYFSNKKFPKNVVILSEYKENDKVSLYSKVDFINNLTSNSELNSKYLTSNRFYDSIILKIPIIVNDGTFLSSLVTKHNIGLSINLQKDEIKSKIIDFRNKFNYSEFSYNCNLLLEQVIKEQNECHDIILNFGIRMS